MHLGATEFLDYKHDNVGRKAVRSQGVGRPPLLTKLHELGRSRRQKAHRRLWRSRDSLHRRQHWRLRASRAHGALLGNDRLHRAGAGPPPRLAIPDGHSR